MHFCHLSATGTFSFENRRTFTSKNNSRIPMPCYYLDRNYNGVLTSFSEYYNISWILFKREIQRTLFHTVYLSSFHMFLLNIAHSVSIILTPISLVNLTCCRLKLRWIYPRTFHTRSPGPINLGRVLCIYRMFCHEGLGLQTLRYRLIAHRGFFTRTSAPTHPLLTTCQGGGGLIV